MKTFLFTALFSLTLTFSAQAQFDFGRIFGGANLAYAKPIGEFSQFAAGGIAYNTVLGYKLTDHVNVGVEYGGALTLSVDDTNDLEIYLYGLSNYLAKGWYSPLDGGFRPYVGVGLGLAKVSEPDVQIQNELTRGAERVGIGANIELGLNIKGFNLAYTFNRSGKVAKNPVFFENVSNLGVNYHRFGIGYVFNF